MITMSWWHVQKTSCLLKNAYQNSYGNIIKILQNLYSPSSTQDLHSLLLVNRLWKISSVKKQKETLWIWTIYHASPNYIRPNGIRHHLNLRSIMHPLSINELDFLLLVSSLTQPRSSIILNAHIARILKNCNEIETSTKLRKRILQTHFR